MFHNTPNKNGNGKLLFQKILIKLQMCHSGKIYTSTIDKSRVHKWNKDNQTARVHMVSEAITFNVSVKPTMIPSIN